MLVVQAPLPFGLMYAILRDKAAVTQEGSDTDADTDADTAADRQRSWWAEVRETLGSGYRDKVCRAVMSVSACVSMLVPV